MGSSKQIRYCQKDVMQLQMGVGMVLLFQNQRGTPCHQCESLYGTATICLSIISHLDKFVGGYHV